MNVSFKNCSFVSCQKRHQLNLIMSNEQFPESDSGYSKGTDKPEVRYVPVEYPGDTDPEDEINLLDLIKTLWDGRKTIVITTAVFGFLGLFFYLFGPSDYESDAVLIQENQQGVSVQLQFLQNLGGFGGGSGGDLSGEVIPAGMYPDIVQSVEFQLRVINHEVEFEEDSLNITLLNYFETHYDPPVTEKVGSFLYDYTLGLPFTLYRGVKSLFSNNTEQLVVVEEEDGQYLVLNRLQRQAIKEMSERIILEMEGGLITVKTRLPDARAAAEVNRYVIELIQEYVIDYRIEKARQDLTFVEDQARLAKTRYDEAQRELAQFRDRNVSLATASAMTQQEELQNQRDIRFNIYNSLAQQVEQARIKLQEETPVFNVLQRPSVPSSASGGSKLLLILSIFLGVFFGIVWVFGRNVLGVIKEHLD